MKRTHRLVAAALVALAGAAIAFAGSAPEALASVSDAAAADVGSVVQIKGAVKEGTLNATGDPVTFVVTDTERDLLVVWDKPLPEHEAGGTIDGRTVVLTGRIVEVDGVKVLAATDMQVGCASKYEQAA